jgi:hypothetical protein
VRNHSQWTVIVAMIAVWMVQPAVDQIVDVVAMRHGFMAAVRPVPVRCIVASGVELRIAAIRIAVAHGDDMLLGAAVLGMLKMAVIEVIDVAVMLDGEMAASGAVNVRRSLAGTALFGCHGGSSVTHPQSLAGKYAERPRRKRGLLDALKIARLSPAGRMTECAPQACPDKSLIVGCSPDSGFTGSHA